jgi:hypothetical protein
VDIIAGASLARPTIHLPLSVVKTGCGDRPVVGSKAKIRFSEIRIHKFETVGLQWRV